MFRFDAARSKVRRSVASRRFSKRRGAKNDDSTNRKATFLYYNDAAAIFPAPTCRRNDFSRIFPPLETRRSYDRYNAQNANDRNAEETAR